MRFVEPDEWRRHIFGKPIRDGRAKEYAMRLCAEVARPVGAGSRRRRGVADRVFRLVGGDRKKEGCEMADSDKGLRYDQDKPMLSLLPAAALVEVARVLTFGARNMGQQLGQSEWSGRG